MRWPDVNDLNKVSDLLYFLRHNSGVYVHKYIKTRHRSESVRREIFTEYKAQDSFHLAQAVLRAKKNVEELETPDSQKLKIRVFQANMKLLIVAVAVVLVTAINSARAQEEVRILFLVI